MKVAGFGFVALFVIVLGAIAYDGRSGGDSPAPTPAPTAAPANQLTLAQNGASAAVSVEIAATFTQREVGLMNRQSLGEDAGMLFLFPRDVQYGFWMKNTYIPLDMLFIGRDGRIAGITAQTTPLSETTLSSPGPVLGVLELNGGFAARHGVRPGDRFAIY